MLACIAVQIVVRRRRRRCCRVVFCCAVVYCAACRQWCKQTQSIYFCFRLNFDDSWHGTIFPHLSGWAKSVFVLQGWGWRARGQGEGGRKGGAGERRAEKRVEEVGVEKAIYLALFILSETVS